jgi:plastocyanin
VSSGILGNGGAYVLRFDAPPGSYEYLCLIHPTMRGRVTVTE